MFFPRDIFNTKLINKQLKISNNFRCRKRLKIFMMHDKRKKIDCIISFKYNFK